MLRVILARLSHGVRVDTTSLATGLPILYTQHLVVRLYFESLVEGPLECQFSTPSTWRCDILSLSWKAHWSAKSLHPAPGGAIQF